MLEAMNDLRPMPLLLVVLLSGASAAVTSYLLSPGPPAQPAPVQTALPLDSQVLEEVLTLRQELGKLSSRIDVLEVAPVERVVVKAQPAEEFETEVRAFMAQQQANTNPGLPIVKEALATIREQEQTEKEALALQRRDEWLAGAVEDITPKLNLSTNQADEMYDLLTAKADQDADLGRRWQSGEDREAIGETKRLNEEQHQTELQGVLSPSQYEDYRELVRQFRRGGK